MDQLHSKGLEEFITIDIIWIVEPPEFSCFARERKTGSF